MSSKRDYYEVLAVGREASDQELKQAYRRLALKFHPDKNPGDHEAEERFKELNEAYQILSQPELRTRYDRFGHAGVGAGAAAGAGFGQGFAGFEDLFDMFGVGDIFGGRSGRRSGPRQGSDLRKEIELTLEQAAVEQKAKLRIPRLETCETCRGSGAAEGSQPVRCSSCAGTGQVRYQQGFFSVARTCSTCRGAGKVIKNVCRTCGGEGRVEGETTLEIRIPAGVEDGSCVKLVGEGQVGEVGARRGDLYIFVHVKQHEFFVRSDADLFCTISISFAQAALGADMTVRTLDGESKVTLAEGTQSGSRIKIKGKGMPLPRGRGRGDLYVGINVITPTNLSQDQRRLLEELAKLETDGHHKRGVRDKVKDILG